MIELRDMELLLALARQKHFAKAAAECGISQPAFSMRIRNLEQSYNITIVRRGNRFQGFTEEGEILLRRARGFLDDAKALEQELASVGGAVSGRLTLGVIPTALSYAMQVLIRMKDKFPGVQARVMSANSLAIQQGIEDGTMDAGITYEDGISPDVLHILPLYFERYVLLAPEGLASGDSISWAEAAKLPLTLLEPQMQNRRILDRMFAEIGVEPQIVAETNAITASTMLAKEGFSATIVPEVLVESIGVLPGTVTLPLTDPKLEKSICMVSPIRTPGRPAVEAMKRLLDKP